MHFWDTFCIHMLTLSLTLGLTFIFVLETPNFSMCLVRCVAMAVIA